jgi:hypothetical protein
MEMQGVEMLALIDGLCYVGFINPVVVVLLLLLLLLVSGDRD